MKPSILYPQSHSGFDVSNYLSEDQTLVFSDMVTVASAASFQQSSIPSGMKLESGVHHDLDFAPATFYASSEFGNDGTQARQAPAASGASGIVPVEPASVLQAGPGSYHHIEAAMTYGEIGSAVGNFVAPISAITFSQQIDPSSVVSLTSGGITINLLYDAAALAAPTSFRAAIQQAASILTAAISDQITVNLKIDYSGTGGGASAGPNSGLFEPYSTVRTALINGATAGDTTFATLPNSSTVQGQSQVAVWNAELKALGLLSPNDVTTDDGGATFATDINPSLLVGVALHELTHAMGRVPYGPQPDIFDLFRFAAPGTMLFQGGATAPASYFSVDGGNSKLADYGQNSDASDFLNSGVQGPNDPFNEFYNGATAQQLSAVDLRQLDALGFHLTGSALLPGASNSSPFFDFVENKSDTNGDGNNDILLRYTTGQVYLWQMSGSLVTASQQVSNLPTSWHIQNSGDFNGDGKGDLLVRNDSGQLYEWQMNGASVTSSQQLAILSTDWHVQNTGDFNGDGKSDILLRNDSGQIYLWTMNGNTITASQQVSNLPTQWHIQGSGDFNGDGKSDILLRNDSGQIYLWTMNGATVTSSQQVSNLPTDWHVQGVGDFNGDGKSDVLLRNDSGQIYLWTMNGATVTSSQQVSLLPNAWHVQGVGDANSDGKADVLLRNDSGQIYLWTMNGPTVTSSQQVSNLPTDWHTMGEHHHDMFGV
jgi:hypothetical protein